MKSHYPELLTVLKQIPKRVATGSIIAGLATTAVSLNAQSIWDGGSASSSDWSDSVNWTGDTLPASSESTAIQLAGNLRTSPVLDSAFTIQTLAFNSGAGAFTLGGSGLLSIKGLGTDTSAVINNSSNLATINSNVRLLGASRFLAASGDLRLGGAFDLNGFNARFSAGGGRTLYLDGVISGTATVQFQGSGSGSRTHVISGTNTYNGVTQILSGTVLLRTDALTTGGAFGANDTYVTMGQSWASGQQVSLLTDGAYTVNRTVAFEYVPTNTYTMGGNSAHVSTFQKEIRIGSGANDVAVNVTSATGGRVNISGNVVKAGSGAGLTNLVKTGAGIVALSGAGNTYTGVTTVSDGTLLINGTLASGGGAVTVADDATLGGSGTINRNVSILDGGALSPGNMDAAGASQGGILTINGSLSLANSSVLTFNLGAPQAIGNDKVNVVGAVTLDGVLNITALSGFREGTYQLFSFTKADFANNSVTMGLLPSGYNYLLDVDLSDNVYGTVSLIVSSSSIPEPSSFALIAGAVVLAGVGFRRSRKRNPIA